MPEDAPDTLFSGLPDDPDAYDVVGAFAAAQDARPGDHTLLRRWTRRFPQFADDLIAFGYARAALGWSLSDPVEEAEPAAHPPLADLVAEAKAQGLSVGAFAHSLGLDKPLLATLNQRLLNAASLPRALAARIAAALGRSTEEVVAYLRQPPRLAARAHYKARQAPSLVAEAPRRRAFAPAPAAAPPQAAYAPIPEVPARMTFADALRSGSTLSEEERAYWLAEIAKGDVLGDE